MQRSATLDNLEVVDVQSGAQKSVGGHLANMFQEATTEKILLRDTFSSSKIKKEVDFVPFFNERDKMGRLILV
jgi:hypothetical protein